jgi:putative FmdB family regulatory protein
MPIYEFKCLRCSHRFEELCRVGEDGSALTCPACGGQTLKRCPSTFSCRSVGGDGQSAPVGGSSCGPT